jgi:hypothetical protein
MVTLAFAIGLLIEGFTRGVLGENSADEPSAAGSPAPAAVLNAGPVISAASPGLRSFKMPPRTVALTFDDGPNPAWTPKVAAVPGAGHVLPGGRPRGELALAGAAGAGRRR